MGKIIGIDLGTTNSAMAVLEGGEPTIIPNAEGEEPPRRSWPSRRPGNSWLVPLPSARRSQTLNTIFSIKRFMGRKFTNVSEEMKIVPSQVVEGPNGDVRVNAKDGQFSPPEISAKVLRSSSATLRPFLEPRSLKQ